MRKGVYPGSFDPITKGHVDLIERAARLVDELYVLVSVSSVKQALFSSEERVELMMESLSEVPNVRVESYEGLTTDYMKKNKIQVLVRGLRQVEDFEYERSMAQYNSILYPSSETLLMYANPSLAFISSRGVKEVARHAKTEDELKRFVPGPVISALMRKFSKK
ncbi:MAG: pantetheine-phosphate adenylyltransferase [Bdellovibrionales bacterium]